MRRSSAIAVPLLVSGLLWACVGSESLTRLDVPQSPPDAKDTSSKLDSGSDSRELPEVTDTSDAPSSDFHHTKCGNGLCDGGEDCGSCPLDCGACPFCGDQECAEDEHCGSCLKDCACGEQELCVVDHCSSCVSWCSHEMVDCGSVDGCDCGDCGCGEECQDGKCVFEVCDGK